MRNKYCSLSITLTIVGILVCALPAKAQWTKVPNFNKGKVNVIRAKGAMLLAGTDTNGIYSSNDFGQTWTERNAGLGSKNVVSLVIKDAAIIACIGDGNSSGSIFISKNNGLSWLPPTFGYYGFTFCLVEQEDSILMGTWYGMSKSPDNGDSWNGVPQSGLPSNASVTAMLANGNTIFAGVSGSSVGGTGIFRSTNNGTTWIKKSTGIANDNYTAIAQNGTKLFAATNGGGVYSSVDNGDSWTAANSGLTNLMVRSLLVNGNSILAGTGDGLFLSTDNAATWTNISTGLPTGTRVTAIGHTGNFLLLGTDSTIWRRQTSEVITSTPKIEPLDISVAIYPNPSNGFFTVELPNQIKADGVTITNTIGQTVYESHNLSLGNTNTFQMNLPEAFEGVYFIQIKTTDGIISKRLVVE